MGVSVGKDGAKMSIRAKYKKLWTHAFYLMMRQDEDTCIFIHVSDEIYLYELLWHDYYVKNMFVCSYSSSLCYHVSLFLYLMSHDDIMYIVFLNHQQGASDILL